MRSLRRNESEFWYADYIGKEEILKNGKRTGQYRTLYGKPVQAFANVSAARGSADSEQFGLHEDYDRVITVCDAAFPVSETSVLWIEKVPEIASDGSTDTPWDYIVVKAARSINSITYAVRKVSIA